MKRTFSNIWQLGVKELRSLWRDPVMLLLIVFSFTAMVYTAASAIPDTLNNAPIAFVDEDDSPLSQRIATAFYPPQFTQPEHISVAEMDAGLDSGRYTFVLYMPPNLQRDVLAGRPAQVQLNVDATRMDQAFSGSAYVEQIVTDEVKTFVQRYRGNSAPSVELALRARFNPALDKTWFSSLLQIIDNITMLAIILTGAALIREREHGTIEHLLVMPVTPTQIMLAKVLAMGTVVLVAAALSLQFVVRGLLAVPIEGSIWLFLVGAALSLFANTALGIYLATVARSMPQFGLLLMLVLLPLILLSGGATPRESMPTLVQYLMLAAPTTHLVQLGEGVLYRGAGLDVVWVQLLALLLIGSVLFALSLQRFRRMLAQMDGG
ncbi:ABC transporter permease [Pseudomonas veronii]|jgi:ABC-2 type transport system permease protein|uniref:ABC transporter permease n=1 Tax=Pseudomonas veronii TaxID=76761 RepID=A0A7Y0ZXD9_PSEVE|nr:MULTISPECIES: ABC transporter permease [Pseudomonas]SEB32681.1 ABC-2 type transport system permease protein [Pseudomonas marginalis]KRP70530.1 membrane protein [Pseudomonas veronii]MCT8962041.1 ABC transporter permease [Pseudomonas veronii]MCT9823289.1 ABC transporter permease [Pseudomonas veronii]NMX39694.1 ABC transporter permease [Pseudomonas veronii]